MTFISSFAILSLVMILRYVVMSGTFSYVVKIPGEVNQRKRDIARSLQSSGVFAFFGAFFILFWEKGWTHIYSQLKSYPYWYLPLSLFIYLFLHDTYFYWTHRWMHRNFFKLIHFAHHESVDPSAWTSFAFHPLEAFIQAVFLPLIVLLVPIHYSVLVIYLLIMSFFGITNHLGKEIYSVRFFRKLSLISYTHHLLHHKKMGHNFGLYFSLWDKWMGTEYVHVH